MCQKYNQKYRPKSHWTNHPKSHSTNSSKKIWGQQKLQDLAFFLDATANKVYILSMASGNFISDSPSEQLQKHTKKNPIQTLIIVSIFDVKCWFFFHGCFFLSFLGSFFHLWQVVFKICSVLFSRFSRTCIVCIFAPRTKETWKNYKESRTCYSLINMRQVQILFNSTKTWHCIVCWFSWISLFLHISCMSWS